MLIGTPPVRGLTTGSDQPVQGTGLAVPAGVEAIFEYNGIYLNDRSGVEVIRVTEIDGIHDADVRDTRDPNPGYHGETPFDALYGGRTLTISGRIEAFSLEKLRDMQMGLRQAFRELVEQPLIFHTNNLQRDHFISCRKIGSISMSDTQQQYGFQYHRNFQITLRASNPRFLSKAVLLSSVALNAASNDLTVTNIGNFEAQPIFRFYDVTNPSVTVVNGDETMSFTYTVPASGMLEIDTERKTIRDQNGNNHFDALSLASEWIELFADGPTTLRVSSTARGATARMDVIWRHTWM